MRVLLIAKGLDLEFLKRVWEGDPFAIACLAGGIALATVITWLYGIYLKWRGQTFANAIGDCEFQFRPNGFFSSRIWTITGQKNGMKYSISAMKLSKRKHRTYIEIVKPAHVTWEKLESALHDSKPGIADASNIQQTSTTIELEFWGVGGDAAFFNSFLNEAAAYIKSVS
jgi:hypothetical protein